MMKHLIVRLRDYNGSIIDGEMYNITDKDKALAMYKSRCRKLGITICNQYYFTIDEYID